MPVMTWPKIGTRLGKRVVTQVGLIRLDPSGRERPVVGLRCDCGGEDIVLVAVAKKHGCCARCAPRGREWTDAERRAHSVRVRDRIAAARRRQEASDARARKAAATRKRRRRAED